MLRDHLYIYFSFLATNSSINIFEESEKPGGRARFRSKIPGFQVILLERLDGRQTFLNESLGVAGGDGIPEKIEGHINPRQILQLKKAQ